MAGQGVKEIRLTQGQVAIVSDDWFEYLNQYKWFAHWTDASKTFYAWRNRHKSEGRPVTIIQMHRVILNAPKGVMVDHSDHNGLHNWIPNIRLAPHGGNRANSRLSKTRTSSGLKGVYWEPRRNLWIARIGINGKTKYLNGFENKMDASNAYNEAALLYFGEFAYLNPIKSLSLDENPDPDCG